MEYPEDTETDYIQQLYELVLEPSFGVLTGIHKFMKLSQRGLEIQAEIEKEGKRGKFVYQQSVMLIMNRMLAYGSQWAHQNLRSEKYNLIIGDFLSFGADLAYKLRIPYLDFSPLQIDYKDLDAYMENKSIDVYTQSKSQGSYIDNKILNNTIYCDCQRKYMYLLNCPFYQIICTSSNLYNICNKEDSHSSSSFPKNKKLFFGNFFENRVPKNRDKKMNECLIVLISLGRELIHNRLLVHVLINSLGKIPKCECILDCGIEEEICLYYKTKYKGFNVSCEISVDVERKLAQEVDIFVCNASANSIYRGIYFAVPMLFFAEDFDQPANAFIFQDKKLGFSVDYKMSLYNNDFQKLEDNFETKLYNCVSKLEFLRENIKRFQQGFFEADTSDDLAQKIFGIISTNPELLLLDLEVFRPKNQESKISLATLNRTQIAKKLLIGVVKRNILNTSSMFSILFISAFFMFIGSILLTDLQGAIKETIVGFRSIFS